MPSSPRSSDRSLPSSPAVRSLLQRAILVALCTGAALAQTATAKPQEPAPSSGSQQPGTATRLPEVLVTESPEAAERRLTEVPIDNPGGRDLIGPREVRESGAMTIKDLLRRSPGVFVQEESGSDSLPNIAIRGVTNGAEGAWRSINLGMYADGIPLAPAPYGGPGNSLFPFALERVYAVDIQRGGGAVRYGPNASVIMAPGAIVTAGGSQPHENFQPYLCVSFIISMFGIFPSQT